MPTKKNIDQPPVTDEDKRLLFEYTRLLHGDEIADKLIQKYEANLFGKNGLAFSIGAESLAFFCLYFLQDVFRAKPDNNVRQLADYHYETWTKLEDMFIRGKFDKLQMVFPRGAAKSTLGSYGLALWAHCYHVSTYTLICQCTEQDVTECIHNIRLSLEENQYIKAVFGDLINSKRYIVNALELELTNGTKIQGLSSASSPRGKRFRSSRPSLVILDDWINQNDILTQEARDKKWKIFTQDVAQVGDTAVWRDKIKIKAGTRFIWLGTLLHSDDMGSRLLKDASWEHVVRKAADIKDPDKYFNTGKWAEYKAMLFNPKDDIARDNAFEFYYQHENEMKFKTLWPDKYSPLDLAMAFYSSPTAFKQELLNDVSIIGTKAFHNMKTESSKIIEDNNFLLTILAIDPAVSTAKNADYTAMAVASKAQNNFRYIRKGIIERLDFDAYMGKVIKLLESYEEINYIVIEKNTFQGLDARKIQELIKQHGTLKHRHIEIINERQSKNKEARIRALTGKIDNGGMIFNEDDPEFNQQVMAYEGELYSTHDDAPDVCSLADEYLDTLNVAVPKVQLFKTSFLGL